jgi:hypothetical protein
VTVLIAFAVGIVLYVAIGLPSLAFPYDLNYGEAQIADQARRAMTGHPQYKSNLNLPPYVIANYGPIYPLLVGAVGAVSRVPLMQAGRAVSLLAALLVAALVGAFSSSLAGPRSAGILSAALFLCNLYVLVWAPLARVDMLGLALSLAGLWLVYRRWRSRLYLGMAVLCLVAATYTRQSYLLAAPLAAAAWLWHNDRRKCIGFVAVFVVAAGTIFAGLDFLTRGGFYLNTVWVYLRASYVPGQVLAQGWALLLVWPLGIALAGIAIADALRPVANSTGRAKGEHRSPAFVRFGLLPYTVAAVLAALTVGKVGSDVNYLLELVAALSIWAGLSLTWWSKRRRLTRSVASALLVAQVALSLVLAWKAVGVNLVTQWRHLADYDRVFAEVRAVTPFGPVLADAHLGMVVRAGQPLYFQPFDYSRLAASGAWDPAPLVAQIRARRFPLILLDSRGTATFDERWPPEVVAAIDQSYVPVEQVQRLTVYEPRR